MFDIPRNKKNIEQLTRLAKQEKVVPFIGAGFSVPACTTWGDFLEQFSQGIKGIFFCLSPFFHSPFSHSLPEG
ncbi:MAG: hypothetical protein GTO45_34730 [Candidatus Aminicenantes bacterium]|nr:hypothetical protein [Candidatus Aminicenantes bacterium]NIM83850.1 hypothetical protein [Candidatus Aminicenantes bacterium]NIN23314.1 hypothetical protein [Candidatus Aminicenantes bacterium]NIN47018.1 hypothetical protein [Candidatus Aminicenantes bacterium]NIN89940.1 hypothetical protein [Candidatus Aminicenantes bacterium]